MSSNEFIPNSFQVPNAYIDRFMALLEPEEFCVLIYAARRIFGFQKRSDRISVSQFSAGLVSRKTGARLDDGTGLNRTTVMRALDNLVRFRLMEKLEENDPKTNAGALYALQLDSDAVDWDALVARKAAKFAASAARAGRARSGKAPKTTTQDPTPQAESTEPAGVVYPIDRGLSDRPGVVYPIDRGRSMGQTGGGLSHRHTISSLNPGGNSGENTTPQPETMEPARVWGEICGQLAGQLSRADLKTWIEPARPVRWDGFTLQVQVGNSFAVSWLTARVKPAADRMLPALVGLPAANIAFIVGGAHG